MSEKKAEAMSSKTAAGPQVVVVGSINMDMVSHSARLPGPGETLMGDAFVMAPGGKGANQAVAAARLGVAVAFVARVGTREHGAQLLQALDQEGVDCRGVVADPQALPGIAVIMVAREGGENSIVYVPGSNAQLSAADVERGQDLLQGARVLVAQLEVPQPAIRRAFELAHQRGVCTVLNAAPALTIEPALLALSDWLVLNETEAVLLAELPAAGAGGLGEAQAAAERLLQRGPRQVVVTLGAQGLLFCHGGGCEHLPARPVQAVDTVGAGDTFVGGLATGLAEGLAPLEALRLGQAAAALAVSRSGVQQAMPYRHEITGS